MGESCKTDAIAARRVSRLGDVPAQTQHGDDADAGAKLKDQAGADAGSSSVMPVKQQDNQAFHFSELFVKARLELQKRQSITLIQVVEEQFNSAADRCSKAYEEMVTMICVTKMVDNENWPPRLKILEELEEDMLNSVASLQEQLIEEEG